MAPTAKEWAERMKTALDGIDPLVEDKDTVQAYLETKLHQYDQDKTTDYDLWELFREDFKDFTTVELWDKVNKPSQQKLRNYLRCAGVFVEQNNPRPIAVSLIKVIQEPEKHSWCNDDILQDGGIRDSLLKGPITSVNIILEGIRCPGIPPPPPPPNLSNQNIEQDDPPPPPPSPPGNQARYPPFVRLPESPIPGLGPGPDFYRLPPPPLNTNPNTNQFPPSPPQYPVPPDDLRC